MIDYPKIGDTYYIIAKYECTDDINRAHKEWIYWNEADAGRGWQYLLEEMSEVSFVGPFCAHCKGQHLGIECPAR